MARERGFIGFEAGEGHDVTTVGTVMPGAIICDGTARTGDFHYQIYRPVAGGATRCTKNLTGAYTCAANGDRVVARMQVAFQVSLMPSVEVMICGLGNGSAGVGEQCLVYLSPAGLLKVDNVVLAPAQSGFAISLNKWYVLRLELTYQRNDAGLDPITGTLQLYDGDTIDSQHPLLLAQVSASGAGAIANFTLNGDPTLGTNIGTASARVIRYDDWWWSVADGADANTTTNAWLAWPTGSRIARVPITSQVLAQWTGAMQLVQDIPNSAVAGNEQTSAAAGLSSTFQHDRAVALGLIPVDQLTPTDLPDAPPFTGQSPPGNLWTSGNYTFEGGLPAPTLVGAVPTSGGGLFQTGVWVAAATLRYYQPPGATSPTRFVGPRTAPVFISGVANGNFSVDVTAAMAAGLPADGFTIPGNVNSAYNRYGIIFFVYSGFNAAGQWDPFTNLTNLQTISGMPLVAVYCPSVNTSVPYSNTHPENRPATRTVRFLGGDYTLLNADLGGPLEGSGGTGGGVLQFYQVGSATAPTVHLPVCAAIKVYANMKRTAGSGNDNILIGGVPTAVLSDNAYHSAGNPQVAYDWVEKTADEFDALSFGVQSGSASATQFGNCIAEVMTAGPTVHRANPYGLYTQKAGIYVSNSGFQQIACGFRPSLVFVKRIGTAAAPGAFKAWWMGGSQSWPLNSTTPESIAIMELNDSGFVVGPANNANGVAATYAYVAIQDGQQDVVNGAYAITASYLRDGGADPAAIPIGIPLAFITSWTPTFAWICGNGATVIKQAETGGANSLALGVGSALMTDGITGFGVNTMTLGANARVNTAGQYPYVVLREDAGALLASVFAHGSFAGTGGVLVVPTPFAPEFVGLGIPNGVYGGHWRSTSGAAGATSVPWIGGNGAANNITAAGALDFTVGASASIVGQTSYWFIFKGDGTFGNPGGPDPDDVIPPDDGGGGGGDAPTICSGGGLPLFPPTIGGHGCTRC